MPDGDGGAAAEPVTMMDYNASITYTVPVTPNAERARSRPTRRAVPRAEVPGVRSHLHGRARATARSTRSSSPDEHEVDLPQVGVVTNYTIITPVQYPGQTETEPFARVHVWLDDTDVILGYQPLSTSPTPTSASACGSPRSGRPRPRRPTSHPPPRAASSAGCPTGEPDVDDPDPRGQDPADGPNAPTTSRSSAGTISPMVRRTDKTEAQLLLEVDHRRGRRRRHHPRARSTSRARAAATTWPARRSRSCRTSTPSARGRRSATRTSRWTARGRCTRRGSGCSSATSTSRWPWARVARRPPTRR